MFAGGRGGWCLCPSACLSLSTTKFANTSSVAIQADGSSEKLTIKEVRLYWKKSYKFFILLIYIFCLVYFYRPLRLHSLTQPRRYASIRSASTSSTSGSAAAAARAPLFVREMTQTTTMHRRSAAILGNFYLYNDFICISVNKWLYQFIPVR